MKWQVWGYFASALITSKLIVDCTMVESWWQAVRQLGQFNCLVDSVIVLHGTNGESRLLMPARGWTWCLQCCRLIGTCLLLLIPQNLYQSNQYWTCCISTLRNRLILSMSKTVVSDLALLVLSTLEYHLPHTDISPCHRNVLFFFNFQFVRRAWIQQHRGLITLTLRGLLC